MSSAGIFSTRCIFDPALRSSFVGQKVPAAMLLSFESGLFCLDAATVATGPDFGILSYFDNFDVFFSHFVFSFCNLLLSVV